MLTLAVGCLSLKFALLAARNADLAMRDWLTGLLNRRGFFKSIGHSVQNIDHTISFLAIDIDHFKHINDQYGHAAGNEVLHDFSNLLKNYDQENRLIARMGGEEFLITLFDIPTFEAVELAEEIRSKVEQNTVTLSNKNIVSFTISTGVYTLSDKDNMELGLAQADEALYQAKRNGRNMVSSLK